MFKRFGIVATVLLALSACATGRFVVADVTRFHTLTAIPTGRTFAIVAVGPEQEQSIAFRQFGDLINARLSALGLKQFSGSNGPGGADYVVTLEYDAEGPVPDVRSHGANFAFGFGYSNFNRPWGYGFGYDPFFDTYTDTRQLFTRRVALNLYKGASYVSGPKERVFEGRAISTGQSGQVESVMPYMLDAIFKDFPGASGRTRTVAVDVPPDAERAEGMTTRPSSRSSY